MAFTPFDESANALIGGGFGSPYRMGWHQYETQFYDGVDKDGKTVKGLLCLKEVGSENVLYLSTIDRELDEVIGYDENGAPKTEVKKRGAFAEKFFSTCVERKAVKSPAVIAIFWEILDSFFNISKPAGCKELELNLKTSKFTALRPDEDGTINEGKAYFIDIVGAHYIAPTTNATAKRGSKAKKS